MQIPLNEDYDSICVPQISIPISYYLIQDGYNTFTLIENGSSYLVTIPVGNYNLNSFCEVVSSLLSNTTSIYIYKLI